MNIETAKMRLKAMVGQPIPQDIMENQDWSYISGLSGGELDRQLSLVSQSIRERISGLESPDKVLLG